VTKFGRPVSGEEQEREFSEKYLVVYIWKIVEFCEIRAGGARHGGACL
jgi:hypothetical protein